MTTTATIVDEVEKPRPKVHRALLAQIRPTGQSPWHLTHAHSHPPLRPDQVLIKTSYVALNPFDWQGVAFKYGIGEGAKVMGRDGAGKIVGVGEDVKNFKLGDRVWFCANSSASHTGAFQEYSVHFAAEVGHTPDHLSDQEAATLGTGLITAGVALFRTLGIPLEALKGDGRTAREKNAAWMLIWGGAGITGVYLIQLARLLGYRIICSASPVNHEYIRSLGADVVLDRWSDSNELLKQIREVSKDDVRIAVDNVGSTTATLCQEVLRGSRTWREQANFETHNDDTAPGRLVPLAGSPKVAIDETDAVRKVDSLRISFSTTFYGHPDFSRALLERFDDLLKKKKLSPARSQLVPGGLYGIEKGLDDLRHGRVQGGFKLVARLADTPTEINITGKRERAADEGEGEAEHVSDKRVREDQGEASANPIKRVKKSISGKQVESPVESGKHSVIKV
ncbi:uncharacterized protein I303_103276 [Kwoniella dejecticola CBS 10117]|uniref:Enoyl reductase (ER) domain-containing protein n=1 Tax=Kwoniella dejecticola CBS 10117 TaxID=1296121 RepID=A0AAJ8KN98_9TREE